VFPMMQSIYTIASRILLGICVLASLLSCAPLTLSIPSVATASPTHRTGTPAAPPAVGATPQYTPFAPLLAEIVALGPVYVTGDRTVPPQALRIAGMILTVILEHRPDIGSVLRQHGVLTVVASRTQRICDLPYFVQYKNDTALCNALGEGGAGGTTTNPVTACDEQNLLGESSDPYNRYDRSPGSYSQNICVHELAHTIMNIGLSPGERDRIETRFLAVRHTGLWTGDYAMTNAMEFWAVMSQFYFWAGPEHLYSAFHHIPNGPGALKQYDPQTFALLDSIYRGSANLR
jgi:hypothetical protein